MKTIEPAIAFSLRVHRLCMQEDKNASHGYKLHKGIVISLLNGNASPMQK